MYFSQCGRQYVFSAQCGTQYVFLTFELNCPLSLAFVDNVFFYISKARKKLNEIIEVK